MSFWVYILRCSNNSYYAGHTDNLEDRIAKHQSLVSIFTGGTIWSK